MEATAMSRREREEEVRKQHILDAAEQLFAEQGLHETSVSDISRVAEFGVGTLYKYFKDKKTLIQSLIDDRLDAHLDEIEESLRYPGSALERIERLIEAYLVSMKKRQRFFSIYFTHFHPDFHDQCCTEGAGHVFHARRQKIRMEMKKVLEQGIENGNFVDIDSDFLLAAFFGMAISFQFQAEQKLKKQWDVEEMKAAFYKVFFGPVLISKKNSAPKRTPSEPAAQR